MTETIEKISDDAREVRELRAYIDDLLTIAKIPLSRIATESGASLQRVKAWIDGTGGESAIAPLLAWKAEIDEASANTGGFVMTPTAERIIRAFDEARESRGGVAHADEEETQERGVALIYGASGVGKSIAAEWYLKSAGNPRPLGVWPVVLMRCTGGEGTREALHAGILASMEGAEFYPQKYEKKIDTIRSRIPDGGLIIFDEAHLLPRRRLDELRYLPDKYGIAIAFMGNLTGYAELVNAKVGQIMSRVGGSLVKVDLPTEGDVDALLAAWGIRGREVRETATIIGGKDGGLRMLANTVRVARKYANVKGKAIDDDILKAAAIRVGAWGVPS
jgi:hypothetical protein